MRAAQHARMIAVCDVDEVHMDEFNDKLRQASSSMYGDYRELLEKEKPDIVTIGTPDHWHVPIAIAALHAGCDVYCEKPLTLTIEEGFQIRDAVKETGHVFQVGTQQRSEHDLLFLKAIAIVQSGRLGKKVNASTSPSAAAPVGGPFPNTKPPEGLDWDMWVGPAQQGRLLDRAAQGVPLVLRLLGRQDDRLGRAPHRHRPMGAGPRQHGPGEDQRQGQVHADRAGAVRLGRLLRRQGLAAQRLQHADDVRHRLRIRRRLDVARVRQLRSPGRTRRSSTTASCSRATTAGSSSTADSSPASRSRK